MAITLIREPEAFTPVYNDMVFTASSTNVAEPAFLYLVDVYINAVLEFRYKVEPDPEFDYMVVDVSNSIEDFVLNSLCSLTSDKGIFDHSASSINYEVKFGEQYEVLGVTTQFPPTATSTKIAYNGSLTSNEFTDYTGALVESTFNTNSPRLLDVRDGDVGCLQLLTNTGTTVTYLQIITIDANGIPIDTYRIDTSIINAEAYGFASHPATINNIDPSNFILPVVPPVQPIIGYNLGVRSYTVLASLSTGATEVFRYNVVDDCGLYTPKTLHFLNREGGFDQFTFELVSRDSISTQRKSYKQNPNRLKSSGAYDYSKADRTNVNYITSTKNSLKLTSDWITEDESEWLRELMTSPEIYLFDGTDYIAIQEVKESGYEIKKDENGEVFNLSINVLFSADDERQRY